MAATTFNMVLFGFEIVGLTVYFIFMYTIHKYRDRAPFNNPFFKIMFIIGIIDIGRQIEDIVIFKFPRWSWLGLNNLVTSQPFFFGKIHAIFVWYFGHAQVVGVLLVAINRVSVCAYLKEWTRSQLHMTFLVLLGLPLLFNVPLWQNGFYFSSNGTDGGAVFHWQNTVLRGNYLLTCGILCSGVAIASGFCYMMIVVKARQVRKEVEKMKSKEEEKNNDDKKLIFIGVVLAIHVGFCGFACTMWAYAIDPPTMSAILPIVLINGDMLNWINPFLLMACSKAVRKHFKAVLMCRPVNDVDSMPGVMVRKPQERQKTLKTKN